jgi:hypothetical protein
MSLFVMCIITVHLPCDVHHYRITDAVSHAALPHKLDVCDILTPSRSDCDMLHYRISPFDQRYNYMLGRESASPTTARTQTTIT